MVVDHVFASEDAKNGRCQPPRRASDTNLCRRVFECSGNMVQPTDAEALLHHAAACMIPQVEKCLQQESQHASANRMPVHLHSLQNCFSTIGLCNLRYQITARLRAQA